MNESGCSRHPDRMPLKRHDILLICPAPGRPMGLGKSSHRYDPRTNALIGPTGRLMSSIFPGDCWEVHADALNILDYWPGELSEVSSGVMRQVWERLSAQAEEWSVWLMLGRLSMSAVLGDRLSHGTPFFERITRESGRGICIGLPHPSGLCRNWNDKEMKSRAIALISGIIFNRVGHG